MLMNDEPDWCEVMAGRMDAGRWAVGDETMKGRSDDDEARQ